MGAERRRENRYPARLLVRVGRRNQMIEFLTNDVSFRGVFIRTDSPPALRQLVKVELVLPDKVVVSGHAMVVHVYARDTNAPKGDGPVPGIGLQFWGSIENEKAWELFVRGLKEQDRFGTSAAKAADKVRRISERFKLAIEVTFDGETLMTRDISENGMAIRTDMAMPVGARAELELKRDGKSFRFDVVVRRTIDEPDFRGLGIEMLDLTPDQRAQLMDFIRGALPSEDRIFINPGDPKLH